MRCREQQAPSKVKGASADRQDPNARTAISHPVPDDT